MVGVNIMPHFMIMSFSGSTSPSKSVTSTSPNMLSCTTK